MILNRGAGCKDHLGESTMSDALLILTNLPDAASAQALAQQLVERKLAACVNILPAVQAVYRWQGVVEQASESTLLIKTAAARYADLEAAIKAAHPYALPEIIALPIVAGLPAYLDWITAETQKDVNV
jgi:periplasmic divalent cation tolerance protein